jgi:methylenetetrahydrofolate reductase (NADPH)
MESLKLSYLCTLIMKVTEHLKAANDTLFSFEILPPLKGKGIQTLYDGIDPLMEFNPKFVNVTYHREEFIYKERLNGLLEKIAVRKRPGTVGICAAIMNRYNVDAVPHLICGGFNQEETENALIDLQFLGIDNVLALRGDSIKSEPVFLAEPGGHKHANELIQQIAQMNQGHYLMDDYKMDPTDFCIGAAGYPEKHFEAMNLEDDLHYVKKKVEAGADYIVTQMFFDNKKYFAFVDACRSMGIEVPIIPGLKPLKSLNHISFIPKYFHIDYPVELSRALNKCKTNQDVEALGIEWGIHQSKELKAAGVPCIHYYTMSNSSSVKAIASQTF